MIDWFVNLSWYQEVLVLLGALYLAWSLFAGFVIGIMRCGDGQASGWRVVFTILVQTLIAPIELLYLIIRHKIGKHPERD